MPRKEAERFAIPHLRILDPEGRVDKKLEPDIAPKEWVRLYRAMVLTRAADERMLKLQRQGRLGTFAPTSGQEAAHCAPVLAMTERDWMVGSFRETGARLMRGERLAAALDYYNGFEEGNVVPDGVRDLPIAVIVASQVPHAVGLAYAMKLRREPDAVLAFVGDGGTSQGDFHEALNFAGVWQVPLVVVIQNNHWAISIPRSAQTRATTLAQKAVAAGIPGIQVDGNDPIAMYVASRDALEQARSGGGPTLIEAVTYRMAMHTTADDPKRYRSDDEVETWAKRDPIPRLRTYLQSRKAWDDEREAALAVEVQAEIEAAVQELETPRERPPDVAFDHVFGTRHPVIEEQRAAFLADLKEAGHG